MALRVLRPDMEATLVDDWVSFEVTREGVLTVRRESAEALVFDVDQWADVHPIDDER